MYTPLPPQKTAWRNTSAGKLYIAANLAAVPVLAQEFLDEAAVAFARPVVAMLSRIMLFVWQRFLILTEQTFSFHALAASVEAYASAFFQIIAYPIYVLLPFAAFAVIRGLPKKEIKGMGRASFPVYVATIFCSLGISVIASYLVSFLRQAMGMIGVYESFPPPEAIFDGFSLVLQVISVCLLPAFIEEFAYRGVVFAEVSRLGGTTCAVIVSSFFFAFMHGSVSTLPLALLFGFFAGWLRGRYEIIGPAIVGHFFVNLTAIGFEQAYIYLPDHLYPVATAIADVLFLLFAAIGLLYFLASNRFEPDHLFGTFYEGACPTGQALLNYGSALLTLVFLVTMAVRMVFSLSLI